ncbi:MAG TPA: hypothetical protein P5191_09045 [Ruminococcus sp.]|nr:hypothetical protein [Ruminococcus sp.]
MTEQLKNLLILLAGIVVILIVVILLFSGKSSFRRIMAVFLNEEGAEEDYMMHRVKAGGGGEPPAAKPNKASEPAQKKVSGPIVEMATLIRKTDDRMRIIESTGQVKLVDEYYELVFMTRKGQQVTIECSAEAYEKIPFNQQGSLTYKKNMLVKFKYYEDTIYN